MANSIVLEKLSNRNLLFLFAGNLVILIILCVAGGKGKIIALTSTLITHPTSDNHSTNFFDVSKDLTFYRWKTVVAKRGTIQFPEYQYCNV